MIRSEELWTRPTLLIDMGGVERELLTVPLLRSQGMVLPQVVPRDSNCIL